MTKVHRVVILLLAMQILGLEASVGLIQNNLTSERVEAASSDDDSTISSCAEETEGPPPQRYTLHQSALPWLEAMQACWRRGEQLAVPRSRADALLLGRLLLASALNVTHSSMVDAIYVGVQDISMDGKWRTLDGLLLSEAGYDLWWEGASGYCGALLADGRYIRQTCNTALAYACEAPPNAATESSSNYTDIRGVGLFRLHEEPLPWSLALLSCDAAGATLAVPASAREAGLLAGVLFTRAAANARLRQHGFLVGITDVAREGEWRTVSGRTLSEAGYAMWGPNEPSGGREQNCGALQEDGRYADVPCLVSMAYCCQLRDSDINSDERTFVQDGFRLFVEPRSWVEALHACHRQNATLAVPTTKTEETAIRNLISAARSKISSLSIFVHVAIHSIGESESWKTLAGDPAWVSRHSYYNGRSYTRQRHYSDSGLCGKMNNDGSYGSQSCNNKLPYVCETAK